MFFSNPRLANPSAVLSPPHSQHCVPARLRPSRLPPHLLSFFAFYRRLDFAPVYLFVGHNQPKSPANPHGQVNPTGRNCQPPIPIRPEFIHHSGFQAPLAFVVAGQSPFPSFAPLLPPLLGTLPQVMRQVYPTPSNPRVAMTTGPPTPPQSAWNNGKPFAAD